MSVVLTGYDDVRERDRLTARPHQLEFAHSTVTFEYGPVGVIARIDYHNRPERRYAGPIGDETMAVLIEVAKNE